MQGVLALGFEESGAVDWSEDRPMPILEFKRLARVLVPKSVENCGSRSMVGDWRAGGYKVVFGLRCNSWLCPKCRVKLSRKWIKKINPEKVERFLTLTVDPKRFENVAAAVEEIYRGYKKLIQAIRRDLGKTFEYFSVVEFTKAGWPHLHILQRGSYVSKQWIINKWDQYGLGIIVQFNEVWGRGAVKHYLTKYLSKEGQAFFHHLRKVRFSKNFFAMVEKVKGWLSDFAYKMSNWSQEVELLCLERDGWNLFARVGEVSLLKFRGT